MTQAPRSFCFLTTFYPPYHFGGEATYLHALSTELAERGHRVTVVHCVDSYRVLTSAAPRAGFRHHPGVTVVGLESRLGRVSPLVTYLSGRPGLKRRPLASVLAEPFDVVHFHLATLIGGPGILRYGEGVKLYTTHDHWLVCPMYDLWQDNREVCSEPHCTRCTLHFRRPPQLWRHTGLLERELRHVDLFLAPSQSTIEQHRRRGFAHPMRRLPNFLPRTAERREAGPAVAPPRAGPAPRRPYFLFVGRLVKLKGVHTLLETFRRYRGADLVVAGDGVEERELRARAADLDHVHFLGRVGGDELRDLYRGAIALLVPGLAYETFGLVAVEAFAQGTPVIARRHGAVPELVDECGGGLTYRTEAGLVEAMEALRSDPARRRELGERAHRGYVERWSEEPHLREYFAAIEHARELRAQRDRTPAVAA